MSDTFVCASCYQTFIKGRSDEEAMAEQIQRFNTAEPLDVVCDDCAQKFYQWLEARRYQ